MSDTPPQSAEPLPPPPRMPVPDLAALPSPLAPGFPVVERVRRLWVLANTAVDLRTAVILAFCGGWLVFTQIHTTVGGYEHAIRPLLEGWNPYLKPMLGHLYWFTMGPIVLFLVPLGLGRVVLGMRPAELGVQLGNWRNGLKWVFAIFGVFLPILVTASFFGTFKRTYPMCGFVGDEMVKWLTGKEGSPWPMLLFEAAYGFYFIGWEFFFRGFMGFGLFRSLGYYSVLVATVPFAVMHVGKPEPEALGSVVAGIFLGFFALRERSFLYGALLHALVAWSMDVLAVWHRYREAIHK